VTLTCAEVVEQVTAYLDEALEPTTERDVEQHLAECRGCEVYVDQCRATVRLVASLPRSGLPAVERDGLLAVFRQRHRPR
jgi:anti-sigma factor RsiW